MPSNTAVSAIELADRFRDVFLSEETGELRVRSGSGCCVLNFDRGLVVSARREPAGDQGDFDLREAVAHAFRGGADGIEFLPGAAPEGEPAADILQTTELLFDGIRAMFGFDEIHDALLALDRVLTLRPTPAVPLERLGLRPVHGFVISRLMSGLAFRDILATVGPEEEDEAGRFLYGLLLLGAAVVDPPLGQGPLRTETLLFERKREVAREMAEINFIRETYASLQEQNPYEIFGIQESATREDVRHAYDEKKKALNEDRFLPKVRDAMRSELGIIEVRLTELYLAMQSRAPIRAPQADETLPNLEAATLRREFTKTEVAATADEQSLLAESYYQKARKYFSQADYHNCIQYCRQAIRQNERVASYHCLMGEAQAKNPDRRWQKMAEQSFQEAARIDPWNADYLVSLGELYKKLGLKSRAKRQFEKALELQPGHAKAGAELHALG